ILGNNIGHFLPFVPIQEENLVQRSLKDRGDKLRNRNNPLRGFEATKDNYSEKREVTYLVELFYWHRSHCSIHKPSMDQNCNKRQISQTGDSFVDSIRMETGGYLVIYNNGGCSEQIRTKP